MKRAKRGLEMFSLSFLDIISCGFGAVVMLVLLFKPSGEPVAAARPITDAPRLDDELGTVLQLRQQLTQLQEQLRAGQAGDAGRAETQRLAAVQERLSRQLDTLRSQGQEMEERLQGMRLVQSTLKEQAALSAGQKDRPRAEEVGGIPVDSDYVVFIIDTSGSMRQIWAQVSRQIIHVLDNHPQVKGFQVLSDLGQSIVSAYEGRWIPDTPGRRKNVISVFNAWAAGSNSSPVEGIEAALTRYARPNITTAIYVFGDDYTGSSYDPVIDQITARNFASGRRLARIHAVGFLSPNTTNRFSILMRELTRRNNGTFLALPP